MQGPTRTLYLNRTRIFLSYSNPTRKFLKNDRVASSVYFSHFREIAARPASQYYSHMNTALVRSPMSFDHKKVNAFLGATEIHNNFPGTNTICIANSHSGGKDEDVLLYSLYLKITGGYLTKDKVKV